MKRNLEAIRILDNMLGEELKELKNLARKQNEGYGKPENQEFWGFMLEVVDTNLCDGFMPLKKSQENTALMVYAVLDHLRYGPLLEMAQGIVAGDFDPSAGAPISVWYAVFLGYRGFDIVIRDGREQVYGNTTAYGKKHTDIPEFSDWEDIFIQYEYEYPTKRRGFWSRDLAGIHDSTREKYRLVNGLAVALGKIGVWVNEDEQLARVAGIDHFGSPGGGFDVILIKLPLGATHKHLTEILAAFNELGEAYRAISIKIDVSLAMTKGYVYGYIFW